MTLPSWVKPVGFLLLAVLAVWLILYAKTCSGQKLMKKEDAAAAASAAQGLANQTVEALHAQQVSSFQAQQGKDDAAAAALATRVADAKRRLENRTQAQPAPAAAAPALPQVPAAEPLATAVDLAAVVAQQKDLIAALEAQHDNDALRLRDRDNVISAQSLELASAHAAEKAFQAQAVQEHAARVAAEGVASSARWEGRLEGGGAGILVGALLKAVL